jgi:hypothetical protein
MIRAYGHELIQLIRLLQLLEDNTSLRVESACEFSDTDPIIADLSDAIDSVEHLGLKQSCIYIRRLIDSINGFGLKHVNEHRMFEVLRDRIIDELESVQFKYVSRPDLYWYLFTGFEDTMQWPSRYPVESAALH